jgi:hypothetical protein
MNDFYAIPRSGFGTSLAAALTEKYASGVTVHFSDDLTCIFSCAAICDKVIFIKKQVFNNYYFTTGYDKINCYFGDAYDHDAVITNPYQVSGDGFTDSYDNPAFGPIVTADLILGDDFLLISSDDPNHTQLALFGKLTNGKFIAMGWTFATNYTRTRFCHGYDTSDLTTEIDTVTLATTCNDDNKFVTMPFLIRKGLDLFTNSNGSYATIPNLFNVAYKGRIVADSFYVSGYGLYSASNVLQLNTSLLCLIGE